MKITVRTTLIATLLFYGSLLVAPHKIIVFFACFVYFFVLWRLLSDFRQALMALFITLVPIIIGKLFVIDLITARQLNIVSRPFGISADVIISIGDLVVACMAIVLVAEAIRGKLAYDRRPLLELLLFLYPVASVISTMAGSVRPEVSILHSLFTIRPLILYYFFASFTPLPLVNALTIVAGGLLLQVVVVVGQVIRGGSIGLIIEPIANYIAIDSSRDAAGLLRYGGTYMHANALGNALLPLLFFVLPTVFHRFEKDGRLLAFSVLSGIGVLAVTMSRSAWLGMASGCAIFFLIVRKRWGMRLRPAYSLTRFQRFAVVFIGIILGLLTVPRLLSTLSSTGAYGSVETRILLLREYSDLMRAYPYFGVGLEMDVYTQYSRSLVRGDWDIDAPNRTAVLYFPEPVHNGFLRLLIETGIVGVLPFIGIFVSLTYFAWKLVRASKTVPLQLGAASVLAMFTAVFVNSLMQPIEPDLSVLVVFTMLYSRNIS